MKTHTIFTLRDGSRHDTFKAAQNHCEEMMGAETRDMLVELMQGGRPLHREAINLVIEKKYDKAIFEYVAWRGEMQQLESFERGEVEDYED